MSKLLYTETGPNGTPYKKGEWKDFAVHNDQEIKGFFGDYRFLSNFHPVRVILDGVQYPSVEHAYQAAKWQPVQRVFFLTCTALETIDYNRVHQPDGYATIAQWDDVKVSTMHALVAQKFDPQKNPENAQRLIATGIRHLEEMNWWGDIFWGTDNTGKGQNRLGKILMEVRAKIR
jgi:ribA/ribD-fused uncharacterized protein